MFVDFAKKNRLLFVLALSICIQWCLLFSLVGLSYVSSIKFQAIKSGLSSASSANFSFWDYLWRSGEVMSTYSNAVRLKGYQDPQISNLINILISGSSTSTSGSTDSSLSSSLLSSFQAFNAAIQASVAFLCLIGFMGVFNLLAIAWLCWQYLLVAQTWNFKKLALVVCLNVVGIWISYHVEDVGNADLTPSHRLMNLQFIRGIKQLQKKQTLFQLNGSFKSPLIEVKNLNFFHRNKSNFLFTKADSVHILKDINLTIKKGSFTVIIGPNGSGKTTLLKALINLYSGFSGEILWMGKKISSLNRSAFAREVSYIPQFLNLQNAISVIDFLEFARYPYRQLLGNSSEVDRELSEQAIEKNNCEHLKNRMINELSGGQKQKIILTSVLVQESEIIVLDEPTSYLDIKNQHQFLEILSQMHSRGKTIITILHDLRQSLKYADHLVVLNEGRIRASGRPKDIVNKDLLRDVFKIDCDISYTSKGVELSNIYAL